MSFKVSVIKKNQILAWMITIMLCVAGYLNYVNDPSKNFDIEVTGIIEDNLGDAVLVDSNNLVSNVDDYMENIEADAKLTTANEYFAASRIDRNNNYAQRIEVYEKMLTNDNIEESQKSIAQEEIKNISDEKNAISIAENLIKLKGFGDVVIMRNGESINVVVAEEQLTEAKVAQIQNIIQNELKSKIENIHINNLISNKIR